MKKSKVQRKPDRVDHQAGRRCCAGRGPVPASRVSPATYYQWKSKYGGLEAPDLRRVRELDADNAAMKDLIAQKL